MNMRQKAVLKGFIQLSQQERNELVEELNKLQNPPTPNTRELLERSIKGEVINFGPAPSGCPCCGR